ncbi:MAG: LVIVD repeat-containing protein [Gaiellaceae bacterium]
MLVCSVVLAGTLVPLAGSSGGPPADVLEAVATFDYSDNMIPTGYSPREIPIDNDLPGAGSFNSDLAFWGKTAIQGSYAGFRIIDISNARKPKEIINYEECFSRFNSAGNQGDITIWGDILMRSWNSSADEGDTCDGVPVAEDAEGVHVFDISDPTDPDVVAFVETPCGSHTQTLVPDLDNNRLLIYSNSSSGAVLGGEPGGEPPISCRGIDIIEVPLADPSAASYLRFEPAGNPAMPAEEHHPCHDTAVILGKTQLVACAGSGSESEGNGINVLTMDPALGGSKEDPEWLYHKETGGISLGHSASFTWDGKIIVVGHEPGGGGGARCEATDDPLERTFFFVEAATGASLGQFTIPRPQTNVENCTTHNYNVVPLRKRYVMVSGNYQSGISVIDFTDPANAEEIAYADPAPLVDPNPPVGIELGGDWSSYWYNGEIYESDITRGLIIWKLADKAVNGARRLDHLNPQTQMFNIRTRIG